MNVFAGDIVFATAGRDKDKPFVVLKADSQFVWLADGRRRRVEKPKKKKLMHIKHSMQSSESLRRTLKSGAVVTNPAIRKALAEQIKNHDA